MATKKRQKKGIIWEMGSMNTKFWEAVLLGKKVDGIIWDPDRTDKEQGYIGGLFIGGREFRFTDKGILKATLQDNEFKKLKRDGSKLLFTPKKDKKKGKTHA